MQIVIITGGTIEDAFAAAFIEEYHPDVIIAADHGLAFCERTGIRPNYIVGDFDSENRETADRFEQKEGIPVDEFQPEKDMTDTDIALQKAISLGATEVYFLGATGTRLDHTLSNIYDLYRLREKGITGYILDTHNRISLHDSGELIVKKSAYPNISLFPFRGPAIGVTLEGFYYPLTDRDLQNGDGGLTVSNYLVQPEGTIRWTSGMLIVMETCD